MSPPLVGRRTLVFLLAPLLMGHESCGGPLSPSADVFLSHHDPVAVERLERDHCEILNFLGMLENTNPSYLECPHVEIRNAGKGFVFYPGSEIFRYFESVPDRIRGYKQLESIEFAEGEAIIRCITGTYASCGMPEVERSGGEWKGGLVTGGGQGTGPSHWSR